MKILKQKEVCAKTGLSRAAIYAGIKNDGFPKSVKLAVRAMGWVETEVDAWLEAKAAQRT